MSTYDDLRLISLSTFVKRIISKMIHMRIVEVLPNIISNNQSSFVKGRSITKNILLAQEIIIDTNKRNTFHNIVEKLDMAKAYDRVSWKYLVEVMRRFGFSKRIVNMIFRLICNY